MSAFLFDQTPRIYEIHHWVTFLNQDTPVVLGAEKVAQKLDAVVLFLYSKKIKRGHYEAVFQLVTDHAKACRRYEITDRCTRLLEEQIKEHPEFWLWSHKRWKHKKNQTKKDQTILLT
jgi:KDO2-lipid IV(A) lauroyltransferase